VEALEGADPGMEGGLVWATAREAVRASTLLVRKSRVSIVHSNHQIAVDQKHLPPNAG
jgi:hypothetical protein